MTAAIDGEIIAVGSTYDDDVAEDSDCVPNLPRREATGVHDHSGVLEAAPGFGPANILLSRALVGRGQAEGRAGRRQVAERLL